MWLALGILATVLGVIVGAWASVAIWWIYRRDRVDALAHRQLVVDALNADGTSGDDDELATLIERADVMESTLGQLVEHANAMTVALDGLPDTLRRKLDGALGRARRAQSEAEEQFSAGLDLMADEQLMQRLPGWMQPIAVEIAKQGSPQAMTWLRTWAASRPDVQRQMLESGAVSAALQKDAKNPLDAYT